MPAGVGDPAGVLPVQEGVRPPQLPPLAAPVAVAGGGGGALPGLVLAVTPVIVPPGVLPLAPDAIVVIGVLATAAVDAVVAAVAGGARVVAAVAGGAVLAVVVPEETCKQLSKVDMKNIYFVAYFIYRYYSAILLQ